MFFEGLHKRLILDLYHRAIWIQASASPTKPSFKSGLDPCIDNFYVYTNNQFVPITEIIFYLQTTCEQTDQWNKWLWALCINLIVCSPSFLSWFELIEFFRPFSGVLKKSMSLQMSLKTFLWMLHSKMRQAWYNWRRLKSHLLSFGNDLGDFHAFILCSCSNFRHICKTRRHSVESWVRPKKLCYEHNC